MKLRSSHLFRRIVRNGIKHKFSLYADDLLLHITDPTICIPTEHTESHFFLRYKLNLEKSESFPVNTAACRFQHSNFPFFL